MGIFREWLTGAQERRTLERELEGTRGESNAHRRERDEAWGEQQRLRDRLAAVEGQFRDVQRAHGDAVREVLSHQGHIDLLHGLLEDARGREVADAGLTARLVTVERHNATYQATTEWAVAHINAIAIERGSLIDRLDDRRGIHPVPTLRFQAPEVTMDPPAGPIGVAASIMGRPIPEGQTAGDVINALRLKRDREAAQTPTDPADLVKAAADLFDELPEGTTERSAPATDPFSDLELP